MLQEQIRRNKLRSVFVLIAFMGLMMLVGVAFGYYFFDNTTSGVLLAIVVAAVYAVMMYFQSTAVIMGLNGAKEITTSQQAPEFWHIAEDMSMAARLPMPKLYIINDSSPNAFATGRDPEHAAVAVTSGLYQMMDRQELEGVLGHEFTHIRNYDIRISTLAVALVSAISFLSGIATRWLFWGGGRRDDREDRDNRATLIFQLIALIFLILAPIAATLVQLAISRQREYLADSGSVELTQNPQGLINALEALKQGQPMAQVDPASAALFMADPKHPARKTAHLFDTHPPLDDRIARLQKLM